MVFDDDPDLFRLKEYTIDGLHAGFGGEVQCECVQVKDWCLVSGWWKLLGGGSHEAMKTDGLKLALANLNEL